MEGATHALLFCGNIFRLRCLREAQSLVDIRKRVFGWSPDAGNDIHDPNPVSGKRARLNMDHSAPVTHTSV
jgi:hypothetical protein